MEFEGAKSVPIVGKGKKTRGNWDFTATKTGLILPMPLIYKGKATRSLPKGVNFPDEFDLTFTENQ